MTEKNQQLIIGDWYPIDDLIIKEEGLEIEVSNGDKFNLTGYQFDNNGICTNYLGYYDYINKKDGLILSRPARRFNTKDKTYCENERMGHRWLGNIIRSYGNRTTYKIEGDILKIFDPSIDDWFDQSIVHLSKDTLILSSKNDSIKEKYIKRERTDIKGERIVDQIIFYYPTTCFSKGKYFSIQQSGDFFSVDYFDRKVFYCQMDKSKYDYIEYLFKNSNLEILLEDQESTDIIKKDTDDPYNPRITFVRNNKVKTFNLLFYEVPITNREFYWAYFTALFIPDYTHLIPSQYEGEGLSTWILSDFESLKLIRKDLSEIDIFSTECFFLATQLIQAKGTDKQFNPSYILTGLNEFPAGIETDGRYFSYFKDGKNRTLDIGFNFIKDNNLD